MMHDAFSGCLIFIKEIQKVISDPAEYKSLRGYPITVAEELLKAYARSADGTGGPTLRPQPPSF